MDEPTLETGTVERPLCVSVIMLVPGHHSGMGLQAVRAQREEEGDIPQLAS